MQYLAQLAVGFDLLVGFGWILLLLYDARELSSYRKFLLKAGPSNTDELVSIIVPARNEQEGIAVCVASLTEQTHTNLEIIIVDDESTDKTYEVASAFQAKDRRVRVIRGEALPAGWVGKNWACHQGFKASNGEWLLFVDSDSVLAKAAVERALVAAKQRNMSVLSIFPTVELNGALPKTIWPVVSSTIRTLYPLRSVNDPKSRRALVFGAFVLFTRKAYQLIGGHEAVKQEAVEDKQIGAHLKSMGVSYEVVISPSLVRARLGEGWRGIWSSIKRIASNPLRNARAKGVAFVVFGLMLFAYPLMVLVVYSLLGYWSLPVQVAAIISILAPAAIVTYDIANTSKPSYVYCLGAFAGGVVLMLGILGGIVSSSVEWRGRIYARK